MGYERILLRSGKGMVMKDKFSLGQVKLQVVAEN